MSDLALVVLQPDTSDFVMKAPAGDISVRVIRNDTSTSNAIMSPYLQKNRHEFKSRVR